MLAAVLRTVTRSGLDDLIKVGLVLSWVDVRFRMARPVQTPATIVRLFLDVSIIPGGRLLRCLYHRLYRIVVLYEVTRIGYRCSLRSWISATTIDGIGPLDMGCNRHIQTVV